MKSIYSILLAGLSAFPLCTLHAQNAATMQNCEYWFDYDFDSRTSEAMNAGSNFQKAFDVSALSAGVHSIGIRFGDNQGRWAAPIVKHFVIPTLPPQNCDDNKATKLHYWFDYNYEERQSVDFANGNAILELDLSGLSAGIHSIGYTVSDNRGYCTYPVVKHFVVPAATPITFDNSIREMKWWLDHHYGDAQTEKMTGGVANLQLDFSSLTPGVHSLSYQVNDERGFWTAPFVKHFVIPCRDASVVTGITAYEYWFNKGNRVRVEVAPQNPLKITDLMIEIKDVVPNALTPDYRFVPDESMVYQPDNVLFGIQAFDNLGHPTSAVVSEAFAFDVPVNPGFHTLQAEEPYDFTAPDINAMQGFKAATVANDSVIFWLSPANGQLDLYDENGQTIATENTVTDYGQKYAALAPGTTVYALLWDVPVSLSEMQITYENRSATGLERVRTGSNGLKIRSGKGTLTVETDREGELSIVSAQGMTVVNKWHPGGLFTCHLPKGIYLIRFNNSPAVKTVVR